MVSHFLYGSVPASEVSFSKPIKELWARSSALAPLRSPCWLLVRNPLSHFLRGTDAEDGILQHSSLSSVPSPTVFFFLPDLEGVMQMPCFWLSLQRFSSLWQLWVCINCCPLKKETPWSAYFKISVFKVMVLKDKTFKKWLVREDRALVN